MRYVKKLGGKLNIDTREDFWNWYQERSAILEYDANMNRKDAERLAMVMTKDYFDKKKRNGI